MNQKKHNIYFITVICVLFFGISFGNMFAKDKEYSESERRILTHKPELTVEGLLSGKFMGEFEQYSLDQFVGREFFRSIKAASTEKLFNKMDNNQLYEYDGYLTKLEYPMNEPMLEYASGLFEQIYNKYMKNTGIRPYFSIIPDKNYYLSKKSGHLSMDYNQFVNEMTGAMPDFSYINIFDLLSEEDYYRTDTHWKQECILPVANRLAEAMGVVLKQEYQVQELEGDFYGVYYGQYALPIEPDVLRYLRNDVLDNCKVTSYGTGKAKESTIYNLNKANGRDPYELFLSGSEPLIEIVNDQSTSDKELIIFRDSFGSSLSPLLVEAYKKITIVDIRYMRSDILGSFITFDNQDVLFLYSTLVLNNSKSLN